MRSLQNLNIGTKLDSETVGVSRQSTESLTVNRLPSTLLEQPLQLVVLDIHSQQRIGLLMDQSSYCAHSLPWSTWHSQAIEIEIFLSRNAQKERETAQSEWVSILKDKNPFFATIMPFLSDSTHMQQSVHISMTMRLSFNLQPVLQQTETALVIHHRWHFLLIEYRYLLLFQTKVFVDLQKLYSFSVSIPRSHYH